MVYSKLFLASVAATMMMMPSFSDAHSWVDCMDWRFNGGKQSFDDNAGYCAGYARRYPVKYNGDQVSPRYAFGSLDSADPNRHYKQSEKNPDDWPACSTGKTYKGGEGEEVGSDETLASPVDSAYGQGKWGPMTVAKPGQQLCVRWPAKNHKDEPDNVVYINMPPTPMSKDPTQRQLNQWTIAKLDYGNCFSGGSDKARCGGCFTVPDRAPGDYLIQWRWKLNGEDNVPEWYTSCSDVRIGNGKGGVAPTATVDPAPSSTESGGKVTTTSKNGKGNVGKPTPNPPNYKKPAPTNNGDDEDDDDDEDNDEEDDEDNDEDDDEDNDEEDDEDNDEDDDEDDDDEDDG
ncbi:hypothetical protein K493DRAFT_100333 [Basidiobolus meristosporus CBS 931.73]|uniref:Chitin-binding type-4 domain-containing protein n=1 Tax=Basidiobolus meristosporus CBS 931.73 TaxID=1314790 RepID=A0A1Y1X187_9FUNG|nr:hypothetical protein K493DRAFT_100333 [Basidiobolus meristosporus CBS 931.73]|eukprot:ORX79462.1 hypothetical protein K493DRAFT_100333 [Basidiobolus meristosporus CBS 931.73]